MHLVIQMPDTPLYVFSWGNNPKRRLLKGRTCRVLQRMTQNSAVVRFVDDRSIEVVSRNALRKVKKAEPQCT